MKPRIRVFTNRIEFENPGMLPRPVEELMRTDESLPRNPVLAKLFRVAKLCESAGFGFDKMLEWKKQTGNDVIFETQVDKTKFTFMLGDKNYIKNEERGINDVKTGMESEKTVEKIPDTVEKTVEKTPKTVEKPKKTVEKPQKTVEKILILIEKNPVITTSQLSESIGISISAINQQIAKLKKKNRLFREGADKGGYWKLNN